MHSNMKIKVLLGAVAVCAVVVAGAGAAVASAGSQVPRLVGGAPVSNVGAEASYGIAADGHPFMHLIKGRIVGKYKLSKISAAPTVTPDVAVSCTEEISNVTKASGNHPFYWSTSQTCRGAFGDQYVATQMWRSSYSGPRGYGSWAYSAHSSGTFISQNWTISCNWEHGKYNYYPVMYGWATAAGQGPTIRSDNTLDNTDCGPSSP
jgi:hypothetical protein